MVAILQTRIVLKIGRGIESLQRGTKWPTKSIKRIEKKLLDWIKTNDRFKEQVKQNLVDKGYASKLYNKVHNKALNLREPQLSAVHQTDLLFLLHNRLLRGKKVYKYALTIVDVLSTFKATEPPS